MNIDKQEILGIESVELLKTEGPVKTYQVNYSDNTITKYTVVNDNLHQVVVNKNINKTLIDDKIYTLDLLSDDKPKYYTYRVLRLEDAIVNEDGSIMSEHISNDKFWPRFDEGRFFLINKAKKIELIFTYAGKTIGTNSETWQAFALNQKEEFTRYVGKFYYTEDKSELYFKAVPQKISFKSLATSIAVVKGDLAAEVVRAEIAEEALDTKINTKQDIISEENKLNYNLLKNTPEIPSVEGLASEDYVDAEVAKKQDKLTPGPNITIDENNVISATGGGGGGTSYIQGKGISISGNIIATTDEIYNGAIAGEMAVQPEDLVDYAKKIDLPTKTSDLTNDSGFLTEHQSLADYSTTAQMNQAIANYHDDTKQAKLTPGPNITIDENNVISATGGKTYVSGNGIIVNNTNNTISADTTVLSTKDDLSSKQDTIEDLSTIRSGAEAGATAVQPGDLTEYAKKTDLPVVPTKISAFENDEGYLTKHQDISGKANVGDSYTKDESDDKYQVKGDYATTAELNAKQDTITEENKLSYNLLKDTPEIPSVEGFVKQSYVDTEVAKKQDKIETYLASIKVNGSNASITDDKGNITSFTVGGGGEGGKTYNSGAGITVDNDNNKISINETYTAKVEDLNKKQDIISETNKLAYSLIEGAPAEVTETTVSNWGFTKNTGTYSKPADGIPVADLADTVQSSLSKADTAVQPETGKGLFSGSYNDLTDKPEGLATETYVNTEVAKKQDKIDADHKLAYSLIDGTPDVTGMLTTSNYADTLNSVYQAKGNYVAAEAGKGLSTNDYDTDAVAEVAKIKDKQDKITEDSPLSAKCVAGVSFMTSEPAEENNDGLKFVVLNSEPMQRYAGYIYIITEE